MNFGPFPPMAGCQRYIGIFTDGIKVHSRNSSPMSSKEKRVVSVCDYPPAAFPFQQQRRMEGQAPRVSTLDNTCRL